MRRACFSYNAKISQVFSLHEKLGNERLLIIDYEKLIQDKDEMLPSIYQFIDLQYKTEYISKLHSGSINKADEFRNNHGNILENYCMPIYEKACGLLSM